MKNIFRIFFLMLLVNVTYGQYNDVVIVLKSEDTLKGRAIVGNYNTIKFKAGKKSKARKISVTDIQYLDRYVSDDSILTYTYEKVKRPNKHYFLAQVYEGKLDVFILEKKGYMAGYGGSPGQMNMSGFSGPHFWSTSYIFVRKEGDDELIFIEKDPFFQKDFVRASETFFEDCPMLVDRIRKKKLKKRDLRQIIRIYNEFCD